MCLPWWLNSQGARLFLDRAVFDWVIYARFGVRGVDRMGGRCGEDEVVWNKRIWVGA